MGSKSQSCPAFLTCSLASQFYNKIINIPSQSTMRIYLWFSIKLVKNYVRVLNSFGTDEKWIQFLTTSFTLCILDLQEIRLEEYITHRLSLPAINEAVELMKRGECLRCVISLE
jgi:hypothetical protein